MPKLSKYFSKLSGRKKEQPLSEKVIEEWYDRLDKDSPELSADQKSQLEKRLWNQIHQATSENERSGSLRKRSLWRPMLTAAACILLTLGLFYYGVNESGKSAFPLTDIPGDLLPTLSRFENNTDASKVLTLADGSQVTLEPKASLFYPAVFNSAQRVVYLNGNAFFDIAKNPNRPFLVYSAQIVTKVLGTSFTIRRNGRSNEIEVAVMTGKVIVENANLGGSGFISSKKGVVLTPNKKVTINQGDYITGLVEEPRLIKESALAAEANAFVFEETPLINVIQKLQEAYGVEIKIENETLMGCPITADLPEASLFAKLEVIHALLNTQSQIKGTSIMLTGGNCAPFHTLQP